MWVEKGPAGAWAPTGFPSGMLGSEGAKINRILTLPDPYLT